jgi:AraC-like DNA-binding protein
MTPWSILNHEFASMSSSAPSAAARTAPVVTTLLDPRERPSVDAAGSGVYQALHRESIDDAVQDVRERRAAAIVVSACRYGDGEAPRLAQFVREYPQTPTIALLSASDTQAARSVLALGRSGVRRLVDVRQTAGWRELRDVLRSEVLGDIERVALARLAIDLSGVSDDCWLFFETLVRDARGVGSVRAVCRQLGVVPSTLMSRFLRLDLPSPKQYLAYLRLMRAARLLENDRLSIASVALTLRYSSPQSFGRHVRTMLGISASEFRRRYDGDGMLERLRTELVLPYKDRLAQLRPLAPGH